MGFGAAADITSSAVADTAATASFDAMSMGGATTAVDMGSMTATDVSAMAADSGGMITVGDAATGVAAGSSAGGIGSFLPSAGTLTSAAGLGSMALKGIGQTNTAKANSEAATFNAQIADMNAALATQQSQWIGQTGTQQVQKSQLETRDLVGATIANQAASGVDVGGKSATDVRTSETTMGATDALNIRNSASRLAYGQEITAASDTEQAKLLRSQAGQDITAGQINVGQTVLGGLANPANNFVSQAVSNSLTGS